MVPFDAEAVCVKVDKLRDRIGNTDFRAQPMEVQNLRLLIRALTESVIKTRPSKTAKKHAISRRVPEGVDQDWQELVDVLVKKGMKATDSSVA